jgi:hypothetical protein
MWKSGSGMQSHDNVMRTSQPFFESQAPVIISVDHFAIFALAMEATYEKNNTVNDLDRNLTHYFTLRPGKRRIREQARHGRAE